MLEELKAKLKNLSPEEMAELKAFLNSGSSEEAPAEETEPVIEKSEAVETTETTEEGSDVAEEPKTDEATSEELPAEEEAPAEPTEEKSEGEEAIPAEEKSEGAEEAPEGEGPTPEETSEEPKEETPAEEAPATEEDDIPMMKKGIEAPTADDDVVPASDNITADDGSEIPVDYEQIIEAQNAKIAALQAENASLKNKYEGAFGFSAKPSVPGKVNPLYDDAIDDVHFHK